MIEEDLKYLVEFANRTDRIPYDMEPREMRELLDGYLMWRYMQHERNYVLYSADAENNIRKNNLHWKEVEM